MHEVLYSLCCDKSEDANILNTNDLPGMAHTDTVINITQNEFHEFVGENCTRIRKSKERVVGEDSPQAHRTGMQDGLMAKTAETSMAMNNLNALTNAYVSEDGEE
jgi:hypothetical protein